MDGNFNAARSVYAADAGLDPDSDGLSNLEEYQTGRNPKINENAAITIINVILIEE